MSNRQTGHQALSGTFSSERARDDMAVIQQEAAERGVSVSQVALERRHAEQERMQADAGRCRPCERATC